MSANRGKRSITLNIAAPEGQAVVKRLAERADVLIENYKVGGLAKYGLDYPALEARSTRASSTARSPASASPGPMRTAPATT